MIKEHGHCGKFSDRNRNTLRKLTISEMKFTCLWKTGNSTPTPFPLPHAKTGPSHRPLWVKHFETPTKIKPVYRKFIIAL